MATSPTQRIGPFPLGMDNRAPDFKLGLPEGAGHLLRDALNVDVTRQGAIKTREGYERVLPGTDAHSLWAPLSGAYALYCDDGGIYRLTPSDPPTTQIIASGYGTVAPVRYAEVNGAVYFTDGVCVGSYHPDSGYTPQWGDAAAKTVGDQALAPMPPGQHIAHHRNRLLVAVGAVLVYSEPFQPNLRDPAKGYELFPAPITCLAAVEGGVFVVADKTYFIADGFPAQTVQAVLPYGGPDQQAGYRDDGGAHWMSEKGLVSCSSTGEFTNLQDDRIAMSVRGSAATLMRESDGMRAIVAALTEQGDLGAGVGSYAQARIISKGKP